MDTKVKYAIMVPWDNDSYIYVTRPAGEMYELEPVLFDTIELAQENARIWGKNAKIVKFEENHGT